MGENTMILRSEEVEKEALLTVAKLMCAAARTAPKGRGVDSMETLILLDGEEKAKVIAELHRLAGETGGALFARDAGNLEKAGAAVLLGTRVQPLGIPGCGYCGLGGCENTIKAGGVCTYNTVNLGIAIGSAVSVASAHKIDNRVMFTLGRAALNVGLFKTDVKQAFGIPLYVGAKSPFFDR